MEPFSFTAGDGQIIQAYRWPAAGEQRAVIQIAHGMGEHAQRYDRTARQLSAAGPGFSVYANDHRGHGRTSPAQQYGDMGPDGWNRVVADALELSEHIREAHPETPIVLLGHSMGSVLCQLFIARRGERLAGVVMSGSPGFESLPRLWAMRLLTRIVRRRSGPTAFSPLLRYLLFGRANQNLDSPPWTGFEWLSRDADQVRRYVTDPMSGFTLRAGSFCDLADGAYHARRRGTIARIPKTLPVYVFSGGSDPFYGDGRNLDRMVAAYRARGISVERKIYPDGRHEMLNEINRDQVVADLVRQLESFVHRRTR